MNQSNIYIGVYNNNEESLFYQITNDVYYDLKSKKKVLTDKIRLNSLIPYKEVIDCGSNRKSGIIKLYDLDRMKNIKLNKLFIGNVYQITGIIEIKSTLVESPVFHLPDINVQSKFNGSQILSNVLLYSDCFDFINLENNVVYSHCIYPEIGDFYVSTKANDLRLFNQVIPVSDVKMEKRKVLELYRKYKESLLQGENK